MPSTPPSRQWRAAVAYPSSMASISATVSARGSAMYRGLKEALYLSPSVILSIDGDGQTDARTEIPLFVRPILEGRADLVLGSRFAKEGLAVQEAWETGELADDPQLQVFGTQLEETVAPPAVPTWEEVAAVIDADVEKAVKGAMPVPDSVADMQSQAERIGTGL